MSFRRRNYLAAFIVSLTFFYLSAVHLDAAVLADTTQQDSEQVNPDIFKNVDVKIIYPWKANEPDLYKDVKCQIVQQAKQIKELKIFRKTSTDCIEIKKGLVKFEILDHATGKLIKRGP